MKKKSVMIVVAVLMLLAFLMSLDPVAEQIARLTNWPLDKIKSIAKTVLFCVIGGFLIYTGAAALAVPMVGISLIVVGLGLVALAVWPFFSRPQTTYDE